MKARNLAKRGLESLFVAARIPQLALRLRRADLPLIVAYHNVHSGDAAPGADRSLHLPLSRFREQLDLLERHFHIVPLADALASRYRHPGGQPIAAVTFDDAYIGALRCAIPELAARALPATVFVAPAFVGGRSFWWDEYLGGIDAPVDFRERALTTCRGEHDLIRAWAGTAKTSPLEEARCATEGDLRRVSSMSGITFGSHTWSHPNLSELTGERLDRELRLPLDWLHERFHNVVPVLAYPYGLSNLCVETAAKQAGYRAGLRLGDPWSTWTLDEPYRIPRLNIPSGVSAAGFTLRISGLIRR